MRVIKLSQKLPGDGLRDYPKLTPTRLIIAESEEGKACAPVGWQRLLE